MPVAHVIDDNPIIMGLSNPSIELIKYGNIYLENISDVSMGLSNPSIEIINYGNIFLEQSSVTEMGLSNPAINITRFDPTGIGS